MTSQSPRALPDRFDLIVVGAGHAGCEAAMAASRLGLATLLLTSNADRIGHLSCNPAIGGLAKGHMVREIDALGGQMGLWADAASIQYRTLNTRKGPAVRATRAQIDRAAYLRVVQRDVFAQADLWIFQDMADRLLVQENAGDRRAAGVVTALGQRFESRHVLLTTGTFLRGLIHVGLTNFPGGRLGDEASQGLSRSLTDIGLTLGRLKTGTTPRLLKDSIDFSRTTPQPGDPPTPFSFRFQATGGEHLEQVPCYLTYTNPETHAAIRSGFDRSPMFSGVITGVGARYCPSIEDKVARFPEKDRHQIFLEPEGLDSPEIYPNGIPTSLPLDIQKAMIASVVGLEQAQIVRPGYAIEYDFVPPTQSALTLQSKVLPGLWLAGQINGTSGYEEAAAQGLWAALNVFCALRGRPAFTPGRDQAYMAVLVDDLTGKGTSEPYRMFTSRAEHRLLLREGNADRRLTPLGRDLGLVGDLQWRLYREKLEAIDAITSALESIMIRPDAATRDALATLGEPPPGKAVPLADILRRPSVGLADLAVFWPELDGWLKTAPEAALEAETEVKYAGYLRRQEELAARFAQAERTPLPQALDYAEVAGLTREAREKLSAIRPSTLGQAGRISGVDPAAVACLEIHLRRLARQMSTTDAPPAA